MTTEERYIIDQFRENIIGHYSKIGIYGIGRNTQLLLDVFREAPIIGLLDAAYDGKELFGKRMLTEDEINEETLDVIVIVARKSVQGIIYPRIAKWEGIIRIVNIEGEDVGKQKSYTAYNIPEYAVDYDDVKRAIENHAYISFDLFDTLVMRRVLNPADIFEYAVRRLHLSDSLQKQLILARFAIEKEAEALKDIDEIYDELAERCHLGNVDRKALKQVEFDLEKENVVGRKSCISLLEYARSIGKKIYILTDMYYGKADLKILCSLSGIAVSEDEIISSCEIRRSKERGDVYQFLMDAAGGNNKAVLHIGDNPVNDYRNALNRKIDAVRILSSSEMLVHSSMASLLSDTGKQEKRCALGLLLSKLFNNPFFLNNTKGKVTVTECKDTGYLFGMIFYSFCCWLIEEACNRGIELLVLPGRDGYLIKKILDILKPPFRYTYIKASRRCYELASISSEKDIRDILNNTSFKGTGEELIASRFGIKTNACTNDEWIAAILKEAAEQRRYLLDYFKRNGLEGSCKMGVFDCVASGTVQMYLEKLLGVRIQGFYFGVKLPCQRGLSIISAFGTLTDYEVKSAVLEHYLLLENMLAEMSGTLLRFNEEGMLFEDNVPSASLPEIQEGILEFAKDANGLSLEKDFAYCNEIVKDIFNGAVIFSDEIKKIFTYDDGYLGENSLVRIWQ
ncbi:MAG: hypothetical protein NC548_24180 [Lachnospiraceae bacterium]|nr:hypothetical protein [Lachnospiraceae bacterium]